MAFLDDMLRGNDVAPSPNRIIQGLKLAALLTERPEQRIDRLSFLAREREGKHRIAQGEERNALARQREERQQKESKRREEREDLTTRLELGAKGRRLSAEEREGLDTGELLGIDFGAGVNVGAGGMSRVAFGDEEFAIPGREAQGELDLQRELDKQAALQKLKQFPLPGLLANAVGMKEGTPSDPSVWDDLIRAATALNPKDAPLDKSTFTDETGDTYRVFIDPKTMEEKRHKLGRKRLSTGEGGITPSEQRLRGKEARQERITQEASRIFLENGGNAEKARQDLERQARFDDTGFLQKNSVEIAQVLKRLESRPNEALEMARLIFGGDIPPEIAAELGVSEPGAPRTRLGGSSADKEAEEFLKSF